MPLSDRIQYALVGAALGAAVGVAGWWLYGLAHSLNYDGPGMDPVLRHWLQACAGLFAAMGAVFGAAVVSFVADALGAMLNFEFDELRTRSSGFYGLVLLAILLAAIWFTTPGLPGA